SSPCGGSCEVAPRADQIAPKAAIAAVVERDRKIACVQCAGSNTLAQILEDDARDIGELEGARLGGRMPFQIRQFAVPDGRSVPDRLGIGAEEAAIEAAWGA